MSFTPERFACAVDIAGPTNLVTFLESIPTYWQPTADMWASRVGDVRTDEGRTFLMDRSPLTCVEDITRPLLMACGGNDARVTVSEAQVIADTLQRQGIPVTMVVYPDEGHGLTRPENRLSFFAVAEAFLADHLGGRAEPIGSDFDGSTIQIPVGGDELATVMGMD